MAISDKLLDKLATKSAFMGLPTRSDFTIVDTNPIDSRKCKVIIAYDLRAGEPTVKQVENFVEKSFNGKIHAATSSACMHPESSAISLVCTLHTDSRPLTDASHMRRIATSVYTDDNTGSIWSVVSDGVHQYLARNTDEDITAMVAERVQRSGRKDARFASLKTAAPMAEVGDQVKFMDESNLILLGEVTKMSGQNATIKANGTDHKLDKQCIIQIVERSSKYLGNEKGILQDYFEKAYGSKDFAKGMSGKLTGEKGLGTTVPETKSKL